MQYQRWQLELQQKFGSIIKLDEPMKYHSHFRIGGPADALAVPTDEKQIIELVQWCFRNAIPFHVIGNGTNLLVRDKGVRGVVIKLDSNFARVTVNLPEITAQAGALLSTVAEAACQHSLKGFEFAAGIPGSIGGALVMNAGAYGGEMKDVVKRARVITAEGKVETWDAKRLDLSYRHSAVRAENALVLEVTIELVPGDCSEIRAKINELNRLRREKQPLAMPSAGSTFKRPPGVAASRLIDEAGLKGYSIGGAQVSPKHAGFIVNTGGATCADVLALMAHVQKVVKDKFGVELEPEVHILGEE